MPVPLSTSESLSVRASLLSFSLIPIFGQKYGLNHLIHGTFEGKGIKAEGKGKAGTEKYIREVK